VQWSALSKFYISHQLVVLFVSTSAVNCQEKSISKMTYNLLSRTLNSAHSSFLIQTQLHEIP